MGYREIRRDMTEGLTGFETKVKRKMRGNESQERIAEELQNVGREYF